MFLTASAVMFVLFAANVAMGAFTQSAPLGDIGEMLVLLAAATLFVVAILKKEADRKRETGS